MRTRRVNALVERDRSSFQGFQRHRTSNISQTSNAFGTMESQPSDSRHRLSSIQQRESFFDVKLQRLYPCSSQSICARQPFVLVKGFALTNHCEREMRERREVATGSN